MSFDSVLDDDQHPTFNGTPEETREWLRQTPRTISEYVVRVGETEELVSTSDYLSVDE